MAKLIAALALCGGCSWTFLDRVPDHAPKTIVCDDDSRWPLVDGTLAIVGYSAAISGIAPAVALDDHGHKTLAGVVGIGVWVSITAGVLFALSSSSGEHKVDRCARARRGWLP